MTNITKYCVVEISGKQFLVAIGDEIVVDKLEGKVGSIIDLDKILLAKDDQLIIGEPYIKKGKLQVKIIDQFKGDKIRIATFKAKARYHKVKGHRQRLTKIKILKINS